MHHHRRGRSSRGRQRTRHSTRQDAVKTGGDRVESSLLALVGRDHPRRPRARRRPHHCGAAAAPRGAPSTLLGARVGGSQARSPRSSRSTYWFTAPHRQLSTSRRRTTSPRSSCSAASAVLAGRSGGSTKRAAPPSGAAARRTSGSISPRGSWAADPARLSPVRAGCARRTVRRSYTLHGARARCRHRRAAGPGTAAAPRFYASRRWKSRCVASRERPLAGADRALLEALVAGLAVRDRPLRLESEARNVCVDAQVGRTRSGFLSAVTHNLRDARSPRSRPRRRRCIALPRPLPPPTATELLDTIYDESERLEQLVTNMLELSRIRAGGLEVRPPARSTCRNLAQAAIRRLRPARAGSSHPPRRAARPRRCRGRPPDDGAGLRQPARNVATLRATRLRDPGVPLREREPAERRDRGPSRRPRSRRPARASVRASSTTSPRVDALSRLQAAPASGSRSCTPS